jgi:hypothetical protein
MKRIVCAIVFVAALVAAAAEARATSEVYLNACSTEPAYGPDWYRCPMNLQPANIVGSDWSLEVLYLIAPRPPTNNHFYVEGSIAQPVYHMILGQQGTWQWGQCDSRLLFTAPPLSYLYYYVSLVTASYPGTVRIVRGQAGPSPPVVPSKFQITYQASGGDCM